MDYIASKDLNLLRVFALLLEEGNVSRAAARLGLTQPALSRALARLRDEFADPLFVRGPGGMLPTPKALELEKPLADALERVGSLYRVPSAFLPAEATGVVRLATTDFFEQVVWIDLVSKLHQLAPGLTFVTSMTGSELPAEALRSGNMQLAIAGFFAEPPGGFMRQALLTDHFVSVVRRNHPLVKKRLTLELFLKLQHVIVSPRGDLDTAVDAKLSAMGRRRHVAASVCSFLSSGPLVAATDLVLTAPSRLVERFVRDLALVPHEPPLELSPIKIVQIWHERFDRDPLNAWLRAAIRSMVPTKG